MSHVEVVAFGQLVLLTRGRDVRGLDVVTGRNIGRYDLYLDQLLSLDLSLLALCQECHILVVQEVIVFFLRLWLSVVLLFFRLALILFLPLPLLVPGVGKVGAVPVLAATLALAAGTRGGRFRSGN